MQNRTIARWVAAAACFLVIVSCLVNLHLVVRPWTATITTTTIRTTTTTATNITDHQDKDQHLVQTVVPDNSTRTNHARPNIALILPTTGRLDTMHLQNFRHVLRSFEKLTVTPDILVLYSDWGSPPAYGDMLLNNTFNLSFPVKVVARPLEDTTTTMASMYPSHYYTGHLKMTFWWAMNDAFVTTGADQVCYSEDDIAIHPDFFVWVKAMRKKIPRGTYWGLFGTGSAFSAPLCVDRFEWSYLLNFYQSFCYKEQGAWDMILFALYQHGPLPPVRAETTTPVSIHLPFYQKGDVANAINDRFAKRLNTQKFVLRTPHYRNGKIEEPASFVDLNYKSFVQKSTRAITKVQLWQIIDYCTQVALETKSKMQVATTLIPIHKYDELEGKDIVGYDITSMDIHQESNEGGDAVQKSKKICNEHADCFGFVHWRGNNQIWFKSNVSSALMRSAATGKKNPVAYVKNCEYTTPADNLCIPKFEYSADG